MRAGRCQRCWAVTHENRLAEHEWAGQLMWSKCLDIATGGEKPSVTSSGEAEEDELCLELNELC